jgi:hypothetical protein
MIVFELPSDVVTAILSLWIDVIALTTLDSALCASKVRLQFLRLVGDDLFVCDTIRTSNVMSGAVYVQQLEWLRNRNVRMRNWIVDRDVAKLFSQQFKKQIAGPPNRSNHLCSLTAKEIARVFSALSLPAACSGLQKLTIERCEHWETLSTVSAAAQQSLQELVMTGCDSRGGESYPPLLNLRGLHVRHLRGARVVESITSPLKAAPNLTDFRLSSAARGPINNESLHILCNQAARLEILELDIQHQEFSPTAVISLAQRCSNLKMLDLTCGVGVSDAAVEAFALHCSRLEGLQLRGEFSAAALSAVALHCGPKLRFLTLDMEHCNPIGLKSLAEHCRLLEELQLYNCGIRTRKPIIQLVSSLPHLRELLLDGSSVVTDEVLTAIATHLSALVTLAICDDRGRHTEAGALALVTSLAQLRRVCIISNHISVCTPAWLNRCREVTPGLVICEQYPASTRYFEQLGW